MSVEDVRRKNELIKKVAAEQGWKLPLRQKTSTSAFYLELNKRKRLMEQSERDRAYQKSVKSKKILIREAKAIAARDLEAVHRYKNIYEKGCGLDVLPKRPITLAKLVENIATLHNVTVADIKSEKRSRVYTRARHHFCYSALRRTKHSAAAVGRFLNRDHTSVLHAVNRHAQVNNLPLPGGYIVASSFREGGRYANP